MRKFLYDEAHRRLYSKRKGPIGLQDFIDGFEEVLKTPYAADMEYWITDLLEADLRSSTTDDVSKLANSFKGRFGRVNMVIIVSMENYGFAHMFCTLAELEDSHIFFDMEKALEFLGIPQLPL